MKEDPGETTGETLKSIEEATASFSLSIYFAVYCQSEVQLSLSKQRRLVKTNSTNFALQRILQN